MGVTPIKVVKGVSKLSQAVIPSYDESESNESIASISNNSNIETYDGSSITATVTENDDDVKNFEITPEMLERGLTEEEKYKYVAQQSYIIDSNIKPLDTSISDNNSRLEELEAIQYSADTYSNPTIYTSAQINERKELVVRSNGYDGSYSDLVSEINELKTQNLIFEQGKKSLEAEQANLKDNATLLTKDYKDYKETVTNVVPEDIEITTKTVYISGVKYTVFSTSYDEYLKEHPDGSVSSIDFYQAATKKIQSLQSTYSGNFLKEISMPYVADMEVLDYMKENYPQFTEVFEYLLATDSDRALKYLESNQELLTKFRGTIDAQTEIAELVKVDDEEINDFSNDFYDVDFSSKESVEEYLGRIEGLDIDNKDVIHELIKNLDYSNEQALKDGVAEIVDTVNGSIKVKNTVLNTLNITGEGLSSGAYDFFEGFEKLLMDGELTAQDYKSMVYMSYLEEHSAWYGTLYQGSSSVGNMLPTITASVVVATVAPELLPSLSATQAGAIGQNVALTLNSISSFGTIQNQLKYEGYEDWRAYLYATLSAASEFATEKWLGGLLGVSDEAGETLIKQMFNEGREEAVQNLFESGFLDTLVLGKDFDFGELTSSTIMSFIMGAGLAGVLNTYTGVLSFSINGVKYSLHGSDYKMISQLLAENPDMPYDEILKRVTGSNLELSEGASTSPSDVQDVSEDIEILDVDDSNQGSQPKSIDYYINQSQNMEESDPGSNKTCYIFDDVVLLSGDNIDPYYGQKKVILDDLKEKGVSVVRIIDKTTIDGKDYELQEKAKGEGLFPMSELLKSEDGPQIFLQTLHSISNEDIEFYEKFLLDWEALIDAGIYIDVANNQNFFYSKGEGITFIDLDLLGTGAKDLEVEKVERKQSKYFEIANILTGSGLINRLKSVRGDATSEIKTIYQKLGIAVINTGGNIADFINQVDPNGQYGLDEYFLEYAFGNDEIFENLTTNLTSTEDLAPFHDFYQRVVNDNKVTDDNLIKRLAIMDDKYSALLLENQVGQVSLEGAEVTTVPATDKNTIQIKSTNPEVVGKYQEIMSQVTQKTIDYLRSIGLDEELVQRLSDKTNDLVVQFIDRKLRQYTVTYNGEEQNLSVGYDTGAFATYMSQLFDGETWTFEPGIFLEEDESNLQRIRHEYTHFLSYLTNLSPNADGNYDNKEGLANTTYDKSDNVIDETFANGFLNEGMTEYLATSGLKTSPNTYFSNCLIIDLLTLNGNTSLFDVYFSQNYQDFLTFASSFEDVTGVDFKIFYDSDVYESGGNIGESKMNQMIEAAIAYQIRTASSLEEAQNIRGKIEESLARYDKYSENMIIPEYSKDEILKYLDAEIQNFRENKGLMVDDISLSSNDNSSSFTKNINQTNTNLFNEAYECVKDYSKFKPFLDKIKLLDADSRRSFIRGLIDSGKIDETHSLCICDIVFDTVMLSELIGTNRLDRFMPNITNEKVGSDIIKSLKRLSTEDFNELFNREEVKQFINNMSIEDFRIILTKLSKNNLNFLQNETLVNKLLSLDDEEFFSVTKNLVVNSGFKKLYNSLGESSPYYTLLNGIQNRFLNVDSYYNNMEEIDGLNDKLYTFNLMFGNQLILSKLKDINNSISNLNKGFYDNIVINSNGLIESESNGKLKFADNSYDHNYKYFTLTYEINGKTKTTEVNLGSNNSFIPLDEMLIAAKNNNLKIVSLEPNILKNSSEIDVSMGLTIGLNEIRVLVDGNVKSFILNHSLGDSTNIYNRFPNASSIEVLSLKPIGDYNAHNLPKNEIYKIEIETDNGTVIRYANTGNSGSLYINDLISNAVTGVKNIKVSSSNISEMIENIEDISKYKVSSEIFDEKSGYGGNQNDIPKLIISMIKGENLSILDTQKAAIINNLITKYFGNLSDVERIKLAEHYASGGCMYMAVANAFALHMGSIENGASIFKDRFGYDLKLEDGENDSYNLEAIAFETYLNYFSSTYGNNISYFLKIDSGVASQDFNYKICSFFEKKGIKVQNNYLNNFSIIKDSKKVTVSILTNMINYNNMMHILSADDFSMILMDRFEPLNNSYDESLNNSTIEVTGDREHVGGHAMIITGIADNGDLIVSSWKGKYRIPFEAVVENAKSGSTSAKFNLRNVSFIIEEYK